MKSERRHELQTNELAKQIAKLPDTTRQYGTRIALVAAFIAVVVFFFYYRSSSRAATEANDALTLQLITQEVIGLTHYQDLDRSRGANGETSPQQAMASLRSNVEAIRKGLATLSDTKNTKILARALQARGDLNLFLATAADLPQATTQPTLAFGDLRENAKSIAFDSYQSILDAYADQPLVVASAHFGLAALSEDQGKWDDARKQYQSIIDQANLPSSIAAQAKARLDSMDQAQKTVYISTQPADDAQSTQALIDALSKQMGQQEPDGLPEEMTPPTTAPSTTAPTSAAPTTAPVSAASTQPAR